MIIVSNQVIYIKRVMMKSLIEDKIISVESELMECLLNTYYGIFFFLILQSQIQKYIKLSKSKMAIFVWMICIFQHSNLIQYIFFYYLVTNCNSHNFFLYLTFTQHIYSHFIMKNYWKCMWRKVIQTWYNNFQATMQIKY